MDKQLNLFPRKEYDINNKSFDSLKEILLERPWREGVYNRQNYGNWIHKMSPYVGRITPSFAHWLIQIFSSETDVILDPFSGIGTIPLEADLMNREVYGVDLNPYAVYVSKAKLDRPDKDYLFDYIDNIKLDNTVNKEDINNTYLLKFFHEKTLQEILSIRNQLMKDISNCKEGAYFILGCLLGILHGNRPGYLSCHTGCIIPYTPREPSHPKFDLNKDIPDYRETKTRLKAKVERTFQNGFSNTYKVNNMFHTNAKSIPLDDNSIDTIISSPPYFNTLNYINDNRLRLEFLGLNKDNRNILEKDLTQQNKTYVEEMIDIGYELVRVTKPNSYIVLVLGDVKKGKEYLNTAEVIEKEYKKHLPIISHGYIDDIIPRNKSLIKNNDNQKLDRILVLQNNKSLS